jgi:hypothetical protein
VVALSVASGLRLPRGCWALSALGSGSAGLQRARHAASASSPLGLAWTVAISKGQVILPRLPRSASIGEGGPCTAADTAMVTAVRGWGRLSQPGVSSRSVDT